MANSPGGWRQRGQKTTPSGPTSAGPGGGGAKASPGADAEARVFRRLFFAQMEAADVDKMGRLIVPDRLRSFADLDKDVVLLGVRDHLELWDADRWTAYIGEHGPRFDAVAEAAFRK